MKCGLTAPLLRSSFLLIENVFNLNPFQRQKSLALNFEGLVQISQELKAMEIAPKSLFKKGET